MKKPRSFHVNVQLPGRIVHVECRIWPTRKPSKDCADSPHFLDPGCRGWIDSLHVFDDLRIDITETFSPRTLSVIRAAVWEASRQFPAPALVSPPFPERAFFDRERERDEQIPLELPSFEDAEKLR